MIAPQSVRLDNYIFQKTIDIDNGNTVLKQCIVNANTIKELEMVDERNYEPIPLTADILEKAGFELSKPETSEAAQLTVYFKMNFGRIYLQGDRGEMFLNKGWLKIYSLHQLQNLYFALTGEELPIAL